MADGEQAIPTGDDVGGGATGASSGVRRSFLADQVGRLAPLEFLMVGVPVPPFDVVQVRRGPEGAWVVGVGGRGDQVPFAPEQEDALGRLGFEHGEVSWSVDVDGPGAAVDKVEEVLAEVLAIDEAAPIDLRHGSTEAEHRAEQQLATMRAQLEPIIAEITGAPPVIDDDGDYVVVVDHNTVYVAPRAIAGRLPVVRVFAITNAGVTMTPDLGMYLSRLNFSLMFGRFSVDIDHGSVWLDETLLGEHVTDDELRFTISMVAATAAEWDDKIAAQFGGQVRAPVDDAPKSRAKPGEGGYL